MDATCLLDAVYILTAQNCYQITFQKWQIDKKHSIQTYAGEFIKGAERVLIHCKLNGIVSLQPQVVITLPLALRASSLQLASCTVYPSLGVLTTSTHLIKFKPSRSNIILCHSSEQHSKTFIVTADYFCVINLQTMSVDVEL